MGGERMSDRRSVWQDVASSLLDGSADSVRALRCPKCQGTLSIKFDPTSPQADGSTAGFLMISCDQCESGYALDGIGEMPPWFEELGRKFTTHPNAGSGTRGAADD